MDVLSKFFMWDWKALINIKKLTKEERMEEKMFYH